jgi:hypothetical protein
MLVNCPKCNFSQPKETYCAKCGIEMDTYKPEQKPIIKTLIHQPIVHIVLFFIIAFVGYSNYKNKVSFESKTNNANQTSQAAQNRKATSIQDLQKNITDIHITNTKADNSLTAKGPSQNLTGTLPTSGQPHIETNIARTPTNAESEQAIIPGALTVGPWTLQVRYIELSSSAYQQWISEAQALDNAYAEMGDFNMGKVIKTNKQFGKNIDLSTKKYSDLKTSKLFSGSLNTDSGSELAISFKFNLSQDNNGTFQGDFDIEDAVGTTKKQFASFFEMKPTELLFIRSVIPHNPGKTDTNDSEFLIIFDFQSSH